ncbi:5-formyltetrahydrofolate cyclo-ligase [Rhizobium sp. Root482]|uniref:5-formyltetrahydrofolate cyclo-ligase n=1 Tax=Rhizobium sp. Root482 TaxID=1736543 RepID=UPI00072801F2|nr:5-formyltetrahydrofolate cyclo-ligase [Rhizobium sp. Root482]KQY12560.1 5-formyltetrahydrofolate cyclo-ligase [Rhizobium sp. Root482]
MNADDDGKSRGYASPACSMHEIDPAYMGLTAPAPSKEWITEWRRGKRQRLIEERSSLVDQTQRDSLTAALIARLDTVVTDVAGKRVSLYWPFKGEPDLRGWMASVNAAGGTCLLPVVTAKGQPLTFRAWKQGEKLERGVWNILFPANGPEQIPDIVIAPLVGFDHDCYRLGYGGGFFDRTLAHLGRAPLVIGVGFSQQAIATIHPLPHDIPMDVIVTDSEVRYRETTLRPSPNI